MMQNPSRISLFALLFVLLLTSLSTRLHAAPSADLWARWVPDETESSLRVDHSDWDGFLKRNLRIAPDGVNRLDYAGVSTADRKVLEGYVDRLAELRPSRMSRDAAKAYWINLYNALTVRTILAHYPVDTIRDIDISPGLFSNGPWGAKLLTIEGEEISLDDIEHRILRPIWKDPLIHYAVNCAALGCPQLRAEAFVPDMLHEQLQEAARVFVNHPRAVRLNGSGIEVSSIYVWFSEDFGDSDAEIIRHIQRFAEPDLSRLLEGRTRISDDFYDWSLNDAARRR